jgi:SAM-dependent methyltransferase
MRRYYQPKTLRDGRVMINLGCGDKMNWDWNNLDLSPQARLAHYPSLVRALKTVGLMPEENYQRIIIKTDPDIIVWNLQKGIPFDDFSFDAAYSSHLFEHFDHEIAPCFLRECYRVLKKGGVCRIVVPDLETLIRDYMASLSTLDRPDDQEAKDRHLASIKALFKDMVAQEILRPGQSSLIVRRIVNSIFGDRDKLGLSHRWMYDRYSLTWYLTNAGFKSVQVMDAFNSNIDDWLSFYLDVEENGAIFRPGSLYVEGVKK